jgi:DNA-binding beta-propeller fold protein YncE
LGALRLKKSAVLLGIVAIISLGFISCNSGAHIILPPSHLTERVLASQSASSPTAAGGLDLIDGEYDTLQRGGISAGTSPGLMAIDPDRSVLLAFDSATNKVDVVNTTKETVAGTIQLQGPTSSMVAPQSTVGYAAVPAAPINGSPAGAVVVMNLTSPSAYPAHRL